VSRVSEVAEDKAADWALANARDLSDEGEILARSQRYARAFALEALSLQELGKALLWRLVACGVFQVRRRRAHQSQTDVWVAEGGYFVSREAFARHQVKGSSLVDVLLGVLLANLSVDAWHRSGEEFSTEKMLEIMKSGFSSINTDTEEGRHAKKFFDFATQVFGKGANSTHGWGGRLEMMRQRALYVDLSRGRVARPGQVTQSDYDFIHEVSKAAQRSLDRMLSMPIPTIIARMFRKRQPQSWDEMGATLAIGFAALDHADAEVARRFWYLSNTR
jgi:hypothetical protein